MHTLKLAVAFGVSLLASAASMAACGGSDTSSGGAGGVGGTNTSSLEGGGGIATNTGGNGGTILANGGGGQGQSSASSGSGGQGPGSGGSNQGGGGAGPGSGGGGGSSSASAQIATVRATADGTGLTLPIDGAFVTYIKPVEGEDPVGFFLQADKAGPAIFVAVDASTITPTAPKVGDKVKLTVTGLLTVDGLHEIIGVTGVSIESSGHAIAPLVTDISSAADVITMLDNYESRMISGTGTITAGFVSAGAPQVSAPWQTTAINDPNLVLRLPATVQTALDLDTTCVVTVNFGPMWRFNAKAQASALQLSDITSATCPVPTVVSAQASASTTVAVKFSRSIDPATLVAASTQFTFDGGLTASAAVIGASPDTVNVTTSAQTSGAAYHLVVANTVKDVTHGAVVTPNSTAFTGYETVAGLLFNEISPNITGGHDLIELLVTSAGTVNGVTIVEESGATDTLLATLPNVEVALNDLIVIHMSPTGTTGIAAASETTAKNQFPNATNSANFDGAWDFLGIDGVGLTNSGRALKIEAPGGAPIDALVVIGSGSPPAAFDSTLAALQAAGLWLPANCGGVACGPGTTPTDRQVSIDYTGVGSTPTGLSVARIAGHATKSAADWKAAAAQSFGLPNP